MSITKEIIVDQIESIRVNDYFIIQIREATVISENNEVISKNFNRYSISPDADTSTITDPVVLAQFNAVMTDSVKQNYQTFLASQQQEVTEESGE